jgi:hypothetical protein
MITDRFLVNQNSAIRSKHYRPRRGPGEQTADLAAASKIVVPASQSVVLMGRGKIAIFAALQQWCCSFAFLSNRR